MNPPLAVIVTASLVNVEESLNVTVNVTFADRELSFVNICVLKRVESAVFGTAAYNVPELGELCVKATDIADVGMSVKVWVEVDDEL